MFSISQGPVVLLVSCAVFACSTRPSSGQKDPPNILWISAEDITTMLGVYGDENANTPNLDAFAARSIRYDKAFATAPVCSPARSCLITGVQAVSLGSQHLRSDVAIPQEIIPFPKYLREKGYYCSNNDKEDYNFSDSTIWDDSSKKAHWRNRKEGQPFFSVFNLGITHQSQVFGNDSVYAGRIAPYANKIIETRPGDVSLLPYYPNTAVIRKLWARYYTNVSIMDWQFANILEELEKDGLKENTIVFFFGDHGTGMPRSKRALYDSGLKVPLLIHIPEQYIDDFYPSKEPVDNRLVSFVDFAPTMLQLAGIQPPAFMQGHAFLSVDHTEQQDFVFGTSDRVDEAYELSRTVRSAGYRYIRNFYPHLPLLQPNFYTDQSMVMQELFRVREISPDEPATRYLFQPFRAVEELYDVSTDPHQMHNLARDRRYLQELASHRAALKEYLLRVRDTGLMPEPWMLQQAGGDTPYELAQSDRFPLIEVLTLADMALVENLSTDLLQDALQSEESLLRYWALVVAQTPGASMDTRAFVPLLADDVAVVRLEAAKLLVKSGDMQGLDVIVKDLDADENSVVLYAARAFEEVADLLTEVPVEVLDIYRQLEKQTSGRWHGQDLYAFWALREVLEK